MIKINLHKKLHAATGDMQLDIQLDISKGTFLTLYGKSGAGKTSILRMLAGLMKADAGYIAINDNVWLDTKNKTDWSPQKRNPGFVFQDYALFPNMTVGENLAFALTKKQDDKIIGELIEIVELGDLRNKKPKTLSGGQKQRVALARALVQRPEILMLDEPLSALDQEMRQKLQQYILQLHREYNLTTILVSHDIPEILKMSDRIAQLDQGKIIKEGTPNEFFKTKLKSVFPSMDTELISVEQEDNQVILTLKVGTEQIKVKTTLDKFSKLIK